MKPKRILFAITCLVMLFNSTNGQNSTPRALLPEKIIDEIIGEASGERAMNHIIEMAAYIHDRPASEYSGYFFETQYVLDKMKEYGLEGAMVNTYPGGKTWDGIKATLWEVSPGHKIVVTSGSISMVHSLAVAKGALGVISYNSPRPIEAPLAIPISGIGG
ncbi:MAG: hypothetical protein NTZ85_02840, partial [Bacteroidia bacterium]|nr:hypothetical protein [Bacteroidia bacterium]